MIRHLFYAMLTTAKPVARIALPEYTEIVAIRPYDCRCNHARLLLVVVDSYAATYQLGRLSISRRGLTMINHMRIG